MKVKRLIVTSILVLCLSLLGSGMAAGQDIIDLVFCMDGSGSMGDDGWLAQVQGTAAAILGVLPHDGTIRITVIQFGSNSQTEVGPVILDATNAGDVANQVATIPYGGGNTNTASCIDLAVDELNGLMPPSTTQIALPGATAVTVDGQTLAADQLVFGVTTQAAVDALTSVTITGDGVSALAVEARAYPVQSLK